MTAAQTLPPPATHTPLASSATFDANLAALSRFNPHVASILRETPPRPDIAFLPTDEPALSAEIGSGTSATPAAGAVQALASRRRPLAEAKTFAQTVDISEAGMYLIAGFGLGYHVAAFLARLTCHGLVIIFEPDAPLLCAVLERIDCTAWIGQANVRILIDADDRGTIVGAVTGAEGYVGLGVRLVDHPASKPRLREPIARLYPHLIDVIESVKMSVLTTLVQARVTIRNLTQNLDRYCASGGVGDLAGVFRGRPGLVISAGPSLARNIDLLARPGLRDRFVIVATQTVIKPLLARGIKPHFLTTLDWSDVGKRFYEGLTPADVDGITLVAEPKVNPAVLDAWAAPGGSLRCVGDALCDRLLGEKLVAPKGSLTPGATVAHLAYYLARHLGCDPVALVGQDLGFTDAQYYASGAAIHNIWAGEVNEFNTLEMLEWQRIARQGAHLRRATDVLGRPIYTDEQMVTYLTQFERDFSLDAAKGLTTIDATEGGVRKQHTTIQTLAEFIDAHWQPDAAPIAIPPALPGPPPARAKVEERVRDVRRQVYRVGDLSRQAAVHLAEIVEHHDDQARVNRLISRIEPLTREVVKLDPGYHLVHTLGQSVGFSRMRADRTIEIEHDLTPMERQRRQIERDLGNVTALGETAEQLCELLDRATDALDGKPKITRDPPNKPLPSHAGRDVIAELKPGGLVAAIIPIDPADAHVLRPIAGGYCPLALTVLRLRRCKGLGPIALVGEDIEAVRRVADQAGIADFVRCLPIPAGEFASRRRHALRSRAWSGACWRGGIAGATCYDEVFIPGATPSLLSQLSAESALVLGPDWCLVDPALTDALIDRHRENPDEFRFVFTQAAPGLVPCLVARLLAEHLAHAPLHGPTSTAIGSVIGYVRQAPMNDAIAGAGCVPVPTIVRDAARRCIADNAAFLDALGRVYASADPVTISAAAAAAAMQAEESAKPSSGPEHLVIELSPSEPRRMLGAVAGDVIDDKSLHRLIADFVAAAPGGALTLVVGGTVPADHARLAQLVAHARSSGVRSIHARTSLRCDAQAAAALFDSRPDVLSVDLLAHTGATYLALTGADDFARVSANLDSILSRATGEPFAPLIVPRFTRRDAAYEDLEPFFARWNERLGTCVIESAPGPVKGERFAPLTLPAAVFRRESLERLTILADGSIVGEPLWSPDSTTVTKLPGPSLAQAWSLATRHRAGANRGAT